MIANLISRICLRLERLGLAAKKGVLSRSVLGRWIIDFVLLPSDILKIFRTYRNNLGSFPNIVFPQSFNEKLQRRKLTARHKRYIQWADKISVRDYVSQQVGESYLTKLYWTGSALGEAPFDLLPNQFVIKGNNGSGSVIIVRSKHKFIIDEAKRETSAWLLRDQSLTFAEWQYRWIDPCLLIEELLTDSMGQIPIDFKFFCFHGRPQFVQLDVNRFTDHQRVFVDLNYERLPFGLIYPNHVDIPQQPSCWQEMIGVAAALAGTEPFVRIDLFDFQGSPRFGEITLHPEAGCGRFYPKSWDVELGKLI